VVSIAIYSTFNAGLGVLRRVRNIDLVQQNFSLKEARFSRELRQVVRLRKLFLTGSKEKVSFGQIVDDRPCRVTYFFDITTGGLMRNVDNLADILTQEGTIDAELKSKPAVFLRKVKALNFSYLYFDSLKKVYAWVEEWERKDALPLAIKLNLTTDKQNYVQTVFFPTAQ